MTKIARSISLFFAIAVGLLLHATYYADHTRAQKADPVKFRHAVLRSEDPGRIIAMIALLPDMTIPKELMVKAEAVGVFPKVVRETALPFGKSFWKSFGLNPDNNIINPVFGMKGREVLAGKQIDPSTVIPQISSFQEALAKYYSR